MVKVFILYNSYHVLCILSGGTRPVSLSGQVKVSVNAVKLLVVYVCSFHGIHCVRVRLYSSVCVVVAIDVIRVQHVSPDSHGWSFCCVVPNMEDAFCGRVPDIGGDVWVNHACRHKHAAVRLVYVGQSPDFGFIGMLVCPCLVLRVPQRVRGVQGSTLQRTGLDGFAYSTGSG